MSVAVDLTAVPVRALPPAALRSQLRIVARRLQGRTVVTDMSATGQLVARQTGPPGPTATVHLVAQAAGPLNGDDLSIAIDVGAGAALTVRTTAATLALPAAGAAQPASKMTISAEIGEGGQLDWRPEPLVLAAGSDLDSSTTFRLAADARLHAQEIVVLGRHGEPGGRARTALAIDVAGDPVLRQRLDTDLLDATGRHVGWPERVSATLVMVDPESPHEIGRSERGVLMSAGPGLLVGSSTGPTAPDAMHALASAAGPAWPWDRP